MICVHPKILSGRGDKGGGETPGLRKLPSEGLWPGGGDSRGGGTTLLLMQRARQKGLGQGRETKGILIGIIFDTICIN